MAEFFYIPIDMQGLEIRNHRMHLLASNPLTPNEGELWWNTTDHIARVKSNAAIRDLFSPDDDFYVRLAEKTSIVDEDELLIADSENQYNYKRITKANLITGLGGITNAYYRFLVDSGTSPVDASGEDDIGLLGDGSVIETVGNIAGNQSITLSLITQLANKIFAGPSSGGLATPTFRSLLNADMPASYNPTSWENAYTHSQDITTNPHNITLADVGGNIVNNIDVVLADGKNFGKYLDGETILSAGMTLEQIIYDLATEYLDSRFTSFSVTGQATTVEVGTTLSGDKTFTWTIDEGSGAVDWIDIYDITDASDIATDTPDDGTQLVTINTIQLNSSGATQQWKGIGTDTGPEPDVDFDSNTFTVTARYYRFYGPSASSPTDSATVRALPTSAWQTASIQTFALYTGNTEIKFVVALPPGVIIDKVIDEDALFADITSEYEVQSNIDVLDAGGTNRSYNIFEMNIAIPYSVTHLHRITTKVA